MNYLVAEHLTGIIPQQDIAPKSVDSRLPVECSTTDGGADFGLKMKRIPLTQGKFAIVDDEDFEWLNQWKWCAQKCFHHWYATRDIWQSSKKSGTLIGMHRIILNAPKALQVDHINGDGLDNRRENLRLCTNAQNQQNQNHKHGRSSEYKGVRKNYNKWEARIVINRKQISLGRFTNQIEAAKAYDKAALESFGGFAKTNEMLGLL